MTDATPLGAGTPPAPRPGSLEHLAGQDPDGPALLDAGSGRALTRRDHDDTATALAHGLRAAHGVTPGTRVALHLPAGPDLLLAQYALAKLGAAPLSLSPALAPSAARALAATAGCALILTGGLPAAPAADAGPRALSAGALPALAARHADGPPLLSGEQAPVAGVQATDPADGPVRLVLRERDAERIARLAPTVADLLGRVALPAGGVHLLGPGAHRPEPQFWAAVALITGGSVVTTAATDAAALLDLLAAHEVTSTVLDGATLRALVALPEDRTGEADLTGLQRIIVDGGPLESAVAEAAADLFGEDVVHRVAATTQTGPYAHTAPGEPAADPADDGALLAGVEWADGPDGAPAVRSPLAADGALGGPVDRGDWPAPPAWAGGPVPLR